MPRSSVLDHWGLAPVEGGHAAIGAVELLVVPAPDEDGLVVLLAVPADPLAEPLVPQGEPGVPLGGGVVVLLVPLGCVVDEFVRVVPGVAGFVGVLAGPVAPGVVGVVEGAVVDVPDCVVVPGCVD